MKFARKTFKKIPLLGKILIFLRKRHHSKKFENSTKYWNDRYDEGGNSGQGSYNEFAEYKGYVINKFISENGLNSVMELGCGDGNQIGYLNAPIYVGYEVSKSAIEKCRQKFKDDRSKSFHLISEYFKNQYDLTLSLDVIYCLVEEHIYHDYLNKLFDSSSQYVIIFSTNHNDNGHTNMHIHHRKFTSWVLKNRPDFELIELVENKLKGKVEAEVSDFYFFKRING